MPPSEFQRKLRAVRGHLRRLILLAGAGRLVVVVVAALVVALLLDWSSKLETPGRMFLLVAASLASLYALWRFLLVPLRVGLGDEELALLVERRYPDLRDRLISTVQFARAGDVAPLSQGMVEQLARDTHAQTAELDFQEVASPRRPALWAAGAALIVIVASVYTMFFPATVAIFACRFFDPFSSIEWPRRTQLSVLAYDKDSHQLALEGPRIFVPKGEDIHLLVRAARYSGKLWRPPRRVSVHYRFPAGGGGRRNVPVGEHATYRTCFPTVIDRFSFYVTGDDATTQTYEVQVRNRPRIEEIRVTLRAPDYTGERERVQADGRGSIAGLAGSLAAIEIRTNKPISAAPDSGRLLVDGHPPIRMAFVDGDCSRLRGSFRLRAGQKHYAIALVDTEGLTNSPPATYRLDVRTDRAPVVKLPQPGSSRKVTPKAIVRIRLVAEDDYGVHRTRFLFRRGEEAEPVAHPFPDPKDDEVEKVERAHEWDLTALGLKEGETVQVYGEAEDAYIQTRGEKTLGPNIGRSPTYNLTVISEAEMASLLQRRQQEVKERVKKLIHRQEASKAGVERLAQSHAEKLDRRKVSLAEREQRKIAAATTNIAKELDSILTDMKSNKVGSLGERQRAQAFGKALRELAARDMTDAAKSIARAARTSKQAEQRKHLTGAAKKQQQVVDDLRAALARFDQWQDIDELIRDARELLLTQKKLNERTAKLARQLFGKPVDQLTQAEKGSARSLARNQQSAREAMRALETKMAEVARRLRTADPAAAKLVEEALSQAAADQIRRRMDDAATRIQQARPASALPFQARATDALKRLLETLNRARSPYLARDLRQLQERVRRQLEQLGRLLKQEQRQLSETAVGNLRRQLARLRKQQAATQGATTKAASPAHLKKQAPIQAKHARKAEGLARKLDRLAADAKSLKGVKETVAKAQQAMKGGAERMAQASKSLAEAKKAQAAKAQGEALKRLAEADRELGKLQAKLAKGKAQAPRLGERAREQQKTAKETGQAAKDIQKTAQEAQKTLPKTAESVKQAGRSTKQAASSMSKAKQQLEQASRQPKAGAAQQAKAEQQQSKAVADLQKAREQLAKAHEQLDLRRRQQQIFELQKALAAMLIRQVAIRVATQELDAATEGGQKPFTHAQSLSLREHADKQGELHSEANDIAKRLESENVPVFLYVMRDTARGMAEVQKLLSEQKVDWMTQETERDIERNIVQLLEALKEEARRLARRQQQQRGGGGGRGRRRPQPLVPPLAQLKQLRTLQTIINERTRALELDRLTPGRARQRLIKNRGARLARKQHEVAKLAEDFAKALEEQTQEQMAPP